MAYYASTLKHNFVETLRGVADTVLYEMALDIILKVERNKSNFEEACHWQNSAIYSEFWRRNKADAYYDAFDRIQVGMGWKERSRAKTM